MDMNFAMPEKWREWTATEFLGAGSYGEVYKAVTEDGRVCAVKIIEIPKTREEADSLRREYGDEETVKSFYTNLVEEYEREIELLTALKDAENIVKVYDHFKEPNGVGWKLYIRMEYLQSFTEYCDVREITEEDVIRFGLDICGALEQCEKLGIVHRDLKPENLLVDEAGTLKLADFGLARTMEASRGSYSIKGTFSYMAPEIYLGQKYDHQVDIYSMGLILYRLLNKNREPFLPLDKKLIYYKDKELALSKRMAGEKLPAPAEASEDLSNIILRACAFKTEDRYPSARAMKDDLIKLQKGRYRRQRVSTSQRRRLFIMAAVLLLALCGAAGFIWTHYFTGPHASMSSDGTLEVYGDDVVTADVVDPYRDDATKIVIKEGITGIGDGCFSGFRSIEEVDLSRSNVKTIDPTAFADCTSLKEFTVPKVVKSIPDYCFTGCTSLETVTLGEETTTIGECAFSDCTKLKTIEGLDHVNVIGGAAFMGTAWEKDHQDKVGCVIHNGSLLSYLGKAHELTIPESASEIGQYAFSENSTLKQVTIGSNVKKIGAEAFYNSMVSEVIFEDPGSIEEIGKSAFSETPWYREQLAVSEPVKVGDIVLEEYD